MIQASHSDESEVHADPIHVGEVMNGQPTFGPPLPEELERQHMARITALQDEIADLSATRDAVAEEVRAGRGDENAKEKLYHVTDALLEAQSELNRINQGY